MKQIPLTQGQVALVDDEDYEFLMQWKWCAVYHKKSNTFYAHRAFWIKNKCTIVRMHRFVLGITDSKVHVDHISHNTLDNRRSNLRIATHAQNMANRSAHKNSISTFLGVTWQTDRNKWRARITKNRKTYNLGYFDEERDAAMAYDKMALQLHGEFGNPNLKGIDKIPMITTLI